MMRNVRVALRSLIRTPGVGVVIVLTLALGIGGASAMFTVVDAVVLRPFPFVDSDRLMALFATSRRDNREGISYPNYLDLHTSRAFTTLAIWKPEFFNLRENDRTEQLVGQRISAGYLTALATPPLLGRAFTPNDDRHGAAPVAMLGERFWTRHFGRATDVIGRRLLLNGTSHTIIGIIPDTVRILAQELMAANDVFVPIGQYDDAMFLNRGSANDTNVIGRLAPNVTIDQARAEMTAVARHLESTYPQFNAGRGVEIVPLKQVIAGTLTPAVLALFGAVGFVLLIACANVANLQFVQTLARSHDFAVRLALGASRGKLLRLAFTESAVLALAGATLGIVTTVLGTRAVVRRLPITLPPIVDVSVTPSVVFFAALLAIGTTLLIALGQALALTSRRLGPQWRSMPVGSVRRHPALQGFVVAQVALTLVLMAGTGLILRSLSRLWTVDPGFVAEGVHTFRITLSPQRVSTPDAVRTTFRALEDRLVALPAIRGASVVFGALPMTGKTTAGIRLEGEAASQTPDEGRIAQFNAVGPGYFNVMGIQLLRGRVFTSDDGLAQPLVAIVDEALANSAFGDESPIGRRFQFGGFPGLVDIVGVVHHVTHTGLDADDGMPVRPQFYIPHAQLNDFLAPATMAGISGVVRSDAPSASVISALHKAIDAIDPDATLQDDGPMTGHIARSLAPRRLTLTPLGAFAAMALLLASLGVYGMVSFATVQRTREIGLRTAVGARPLDIARLIVGGAQRTVFVGLAIGVVIALGAGRALTSLLFGVSVADPLTLASVSALLALVTLFACAAPTWRALRLNPTMALRSE